MRWNFRGGVGVDVGGRVVFGNVAAATIRWAGPFVVLLCWPCAWCFERGLLRLGKTEDLGYDSAIFIREAEAIFVL